MLLIWNYLLKKKKNHATAADLDHFLKTRSLMLLLLLLADLDPKQHNDDADAAVLSRSHIVVRRALAADLNTGAMLTAVNLILATILLCYLAESTHVCCFGRARAEVVLTTPLAFEWLVDRDAKSGRRGRYICAIFSKSVLTFGPCKRTVTATVRTVLSGLYYQQCAIRTVLGALWS